MRIIVIVGGVLSGLGKGIVTCSIGKMLQQYGFSVTSIKIDPYINYDAGTMRPTEHGEVWVTDDGGEIDQDLGNYERFLNIDIPKMNNITTGKVYKNVIEKERKGAYLGKTVQFIPHIPDEIKRIIKEAGKGYDFILVEMGGNVGDYENIPFLFATKSLEMELGNKNVNHVLVTYLPVPGHIGEMKTKPTQHAIMMLRQHGITPDIIIGRGERAMDVERKSKIELYANIGREDVISCPDVKTIYEVPLVLERDGLGSRLLKKFKIKAKKQADWSRWEEKVNIIKNASNEISICIIGKYVDTGDFSLHDSYISVNEALVHAGAHLNSRINIDWVDSKTFEKDNTKVEELKKYDGIVVPGGFGSSGVEGKIMAAEFARKNNIPYLGLCYGMQLALVEHARNVCMLEGAHTTEVEPNTKYAVIDVLPEQKKILAESQYGATMRLGAYAAILKNDTLIAGIYKNTGRLDKDIERLAILKKKKDELFRVGILDDKSDVILERHRHRYEVNPRFIEAFEKNGVVFSGKHVRADGQELMEFMELKGHPCFIGTQGHPEFKSRIEDPAPMFVKFVESAILNSAKTRNKN